MNEQETTIVLTTPPTLPTPPMLAPAPAPLPEPVKQTLANEDKLKRQLGTSLVNLINLMPTHNLLRGLIVSKTGKYVPEDITTSDGIMKWLHDELFKPPLSLSPAPPPATPKVNVADLNDVSFDITYDTAVCGKCDFNGRRHYKTEFTITAAKIKELYEAAERDMERFQKLLYEYLITTDIDTEHASILGEDFEYCDHEDMEEDVPENTYIKNQDDVIDSLIEHIEETLIDEEEETEENEEDVAF